MAEFEAKAPANPAGPSPVRRPGSIRRTSTIDTNWPEGLGFPMRMRGHARDLITPRDGAEPWVLAEDETDTLVSTGREIMSISASRPVENLQNYVGARGGGHLRREIARLSPGELANGTPLHLLLDDLAGASLVAGWAWSRWTTQWMERMRATAAQAAPDAPPGGGPGRNGQMEGICSGFRPGSSALRSDGGADPVNQSSAVVPPLLNSADPRGWHDLRQQDGVGMRRARRIDVWLDDVVQIDIGFQDSATSPTGGDRIAIHEYQVSATADPQSLELLSIVVDPRVLPYRECPGASPNASRMVGVQLRGFRQDVLDRLPGILGCTHLNDVLRSMADVPRLLGAIKEV